MKVIKITRNYDYTSWGCYGVIGYIEKRGLTITFDNNETLTFYYTYSARAYGTAHFVTPNHNYTELNLRRNLNHNQYVSAVNYHFYKTLENLQINLLNKELKISEIRKIIKRGGQVG